MRSRSLGSIVACTIVAVAMVAPAARAACGTPPAMPPLAFEGVRTVDPVRAGGEPVVQALPDGTLIYASHAGTTHLYKPGVAETDFIAPYNGATYLWRSDDSGESWRYVGLLGGETGPHAAVTGFSDPTIGVDAAGTVYTAGITLANAYVAASTDSGRTWEGNTLAALEVDREWLAGDQPGVVYLIANEQSRGRMLWTSTDGGTTWNFTAGISLEGSGAPSPIAVDPVDGRLYFPAGSQSAGSSAQVQIFPDLRAGNNESIRSWIPRGLPHSYGFVNAIALDAAGNVYIVSNTSREIRMSYSTDRGLTWRTGTVASVPDGTVVWPWVSAGDDGHVAVSWLQADGTSYNEGAWRVMAAQTVTGHGWRSACGKELPPRFEIAVATPDPIHVGEICSQGLGCNADAFADRRLGDYHTSTITPDGTLVIAFGMTAGDPGGSISHPAIVRQAGGVDFVAGP